MSRGNISATERARRKQKHIPFTLGKIRKGHVSQDLPHIVSLIDDLFTAYAAVPDDDTAAFKVILKRISKDEENQNE